MIGKVIDRAALTVLGTAGLYLFFLNAGLGIPAGCALTFVCAALARHVLRHRPRRRRITAAQAEASLLSIVMREEDAAKDALRTLTGRNDGVFIIRHPEGTLTLNELFEIWRESGDGASIVATCSPEEGAARFAKARKLDLIDRGGLVKRMCKTGLCVMGEAPGEPLSSRLGRLWAGIRVRPRMFLYSLSLLGAYLVTGQALCLVCALGVLAVAGIKLIDQYA